MQENKQESQELSKDQEFKERQAAFVKEYGELVSKYGIDYASYPMWVPDGNGGFRTIVQNTPIDVKNMPKPSPFISK